MEKIFLDIQKIFLDIQDDCVNKIDIDFYPNQERKVFINFFEPGRMSNAYAEFSIDVNYKKEDLSHQFNDATFFGKLGVSDNLYLYLPKDKQYALKVLNRLGECEIKNGKFVDCNVEARNIYLENVEAKGFINSLSANKDAKITLIDSKLEIVNGGNIEISNSCVDKILAFQSEFNINIKNNSKIHELYSPDIKMYYPSHAYTNIEDSTIENINYKDGYLYLKRCNIGNVVCKNGHINVLNSTFIKRSNIEINNNCKFILCNESGYNIKKTPLGKINIYHNKEKEAKVLINRGSFVFNHKMIRKREYKYY